MTFIYPISTTWQDYPDNENLALILYVIGCEINCKNCHNKNINNKNILNLSISEIYDIIIKESIKHKTNKLVISGGDPLFKENINNIKEFLNLNSIENNFEICIYTGYDIEYVKRNNITNFKYIKCGCYQEEKKEKSIKTNEYIRFVSKNQKLFDCDYNQISIDNIYYFKEKINV